MYICIYRAPSWCGHLAAPPSESTAASDRYAIMYVYIYIYIYMCRHTHAIIYIYIYIYIYIQYKGRGVPRKGVWASVNARAWACEELGVKHNQTGCYLRPPFLGAPWVPSRLGGRRDAAKHGAKPLDGAWWRRTRRALARRRAETVPSDVPRNPKRCLESIIDQ